MGNAGVYIDRAIGHLHDLDFIQFFQNSARGLTEHGVIVLKDNCCDSRDWTFVVDKSDSSISRYVRAVIMLHCHDNIGNTT